MSKDIRWHQRFANYNRALSKLQEVVAKIDPELEDEELEESLSDIEKEGVIQRFEYTHELAWNVMKDYLVYQGNPNIAGSRDATREAFKIGLIQDGKIWLEMITSRNETSHTYNEETADSIFRSVVRNYFPLFIAFQATMEDKRSGEQGEFLS